jgi:hypothetical protein
MRAIGEEVFRAKRSIALDGECVPNGLFLIGLRM